MASIVLGIHTGDGVVLGILAGAGAVLTGVVTMEAIIVDGMAIVDMDSITMVTTDVDLAETIMAIVEM